MRTRTGPACLRACSATRGFLELRDGVPQRARDLYLRKPDEFADLLFAHSDDAVQNLRREGIDSKRIHLVGNTMIDTLLKNLGALTPT